MMMMMNDDDDSGKKMPLKAWFRCVRKTANAWGFPFVALFRFSERSAKNIEQIVREGKKNKKKRWPGRASRTSLFPPVRHPGLFVLRHPSQFIRTCACPYTCEGIYACMRIKYGVNCDTSNAWQFYPLSQEWTLNMVVSPFSSEGMLLRWKTHTVSDMYTRWGWQDRSKTQSLGQKTLENPYDDAALCSDTNTK